VSDELKTSAKGMSKLVREEYGLADLGKTGKGRGAGGVNQGDRPQEGIRDRGQTLPEKKNRGGEDTVGPWIAIGW